MVTATGSPRSVLRMLSRALLVGALASLPVLAVVGASGSDATPVAQCRAFLGSMNNGVCLDDPTPAPAPDAGTPSVSFGGPGNGITTSPLFPGQTFNIPLG